MSNLKPTTSRLAQVLSRASSSFWRRRFLWLLVFIVTAAYSSLSILRHLHFNSSAYDLGIFDQAVWQYSRFHAPFDSVRSNLLTENILSDHFHPILILLAPMYWLLNTVAALLVAQALLFALAIVPIFLFTEKRLGQASAYLFALSYSIFWGVQKAIEFDFHEIAFAVPLIALAIYFIDEKRWKAYFVCLGCLLLTKEDLSVLVVFFGVYLIAIKQFKRGLISIGAGLVWFFAALKIFIPFFTAPSAIRVGSFYRYWSYNQFGTDPLSALWTMIKNPLLVIRTLFSPVIKLQTYWYIFHPFLFLAFCSPLFILALPLIAERFLSQGAQFWGLDFHYTATLAPVLVMASVDGLFRIARLLKQEAHARRLAISASILMLVLNLYLLPRFPLWNLTSVQYWRLSSSDQAGRQAVSLIPRTASVAATAPITPHLTHRPEIYVLNPMIVIPDADYIIASERLSSFPFANFQEIKYYLDYQQARGYRQVFAQEGWIVLKREATTGTPPPIYNSAAFVEQSVPTLMTAGQSYEVQVTMRNTGISPWTKSEAYRLGILSANRDWGIERVEVPDTVTANSNATFKFKVTAPAMPGSYPFHCRMVKEGVAFFGESTPELSVNVRASTQSPQ